MTDRIEVGPRAPAQQPRAAGPARHSYQPAVTARPISTFPNRKVIVAGVVVVLLIVVAIIGHVVGSANAISVGDG